MKIIIKLQLTKLQNLDRFCITRIMAFCIYFLITKRIFTFSFLTVLHRQNYFCIFILYLAILPYSHINFNGTQWYYKKKILSVLFLCLHDIFLYLKSLILFLFKVFIRKDYKILSNVCLVSQSIIYWETKIFLLPDNRL